MRLPACLNLYSTISKNDDFKIGRICKNDGKEKAKQYDIYMIDVVYFTPLIFLLMLWQQLQTWNECVAFYRY